MQYSADGAIVNSAFIFIKPHAITAKVVALVEGALGKAGMEVVSTGSVSNDVIEEGMLIDNHYGTIADRSFRMAPQNIAVQAKGRAAFKQMAGMEWEEALANNLIYNAKDACEKLKVDGGDF